MKLNIKMLTLYVSVVLFCLSCFTSHLIGKTYARYVVSDSASDSARVAAFKIDVESHNDFNSTQIIALNGFYPGFKKSYTFTVKNSSEVAVAFSVTAENLTDNLPIKTQLLSGGNVVKEGYLAPGAQETTFTFEIYWDSTVTDPIYAGKVDLLQLRIAAEQID